MSRAIRRWTYRPWYRDRKLRRAPSHIGIIAAMQPRSSPTRRLMLVESTMLCDTPCEWADKVVSGVQIHTPERRVETYAYGGGHVDVYRLTPGCELETSEAFRLTAACNAMLGTSYDTLAAGLSGLAISRRVLCRVADFSCLFCSELVARLLQVLNRMNWSNPADYTPGDLLRELVMTGVYAHERRLL